MAVKGFKLLSYYRKGLPCYGYFCPFCGRVYGEKELCEHFLFELRNVPYFTNDFKEKEEYERKRCSYDKALSDLRVSVRSGKISVREYLKIRDKINQEFKKVLLENFTTTKRR